MNKRTTLRFDKVFPVAISSPDFGELQGIARNISSGGMFIETLEPLPLGSALRVHFSMPDTPGEIIARAEVKGHYFMNYSDATGPRAITGMGLRFIGFDDGSEARIVGRLGSMQTLH